MNGKITHAAESMATQIEVSRVVRYYDIGKPFVDGVYADAKYADSKNGGWSGYSAEGMVSTYREDGSLSAQENYSKGRLEGVSKQLRRDASTANVSEYHKGQLIKLVCLDGNGIERYREERFEDGSRKSATPDVSLEDALKQKLCDTD